jgi:predicted enzyme related to lactoylglutathione lyase
VPDPLDALRTPITPLAPDPGFAAGLRRRLERALGRPANEEDEADGDELADQTDRHEEEDHEMTDVLLRNGLSRNGSHHGDVSYITLALPDAAAGRRFYGQVLGWTFGPGQLESAGNQVEEVIPQVGLWPGLAWRSGVAPGAILSWRVDDIAAAVGSVRAGGGTATEPAPRPYGLESECSDGQGLRFWLHQLPPPGEPAGPNGDRAGDISYVVIRVADLERARGLFGSVLGWRFSPGNTGVHVEGPVPMTGMSEGDPGVVLCYQVDDISAAVERVAEAAGLAGEVEQRPYGLEALCTDNQGVDFYLHQFS